MICQGQRVFYGSDFSHGIFDCVLISRKSKMQEDPKSIIFKNLDGHELRRLMAFWRNQALCGSHEVRGILYVFEAEMMRQCIYSYFTANDSAFI